MVQRTACPLSASLRRSLQMDHAVWLSRPEVGSSELWSAHAPAIKYTLGIE